MDASRFHALRLGRNEVVLDTAIGHLRRLELGAGDGVIAPLHVAPWVGDGPVDRESALPPTEQGLSGDFFCAPFCMSDIEDAPLHGWTANAPWRLVAEEATPGETAATYVLSRTVLGAEVRKVLRFRADEPFLYISHEFIGGTGQLPVSHHAMIHVAATARLSFSPKALFFTPDVPAETDPSRGRSLLQYPARGTDPGAVPLQGGGTADIHTYPFAERHEDLLTLMEAPGGALGWSAAVREAEDDIVLLLKDSRVLPSTMLWMSNGGRYYPPWSGRHLGVLGIEDGRTFGPAGHRASIQPNALTALGYETALELAGTPVIRYAIGAIRKPQGWTQVREVATSGEALTLADVGGETLSLPFAGNWLLGAAGAASRAPAGAAPAPGSGSPAPRGLGRPLR